MWAAMWGALLRQGKLQEAARKFRAAIKLNAGYYHAHLNLGQVLMDSGSLDAAVEEFETAVRLRRRAGLF